MFLPNFIRSCFYSLILVLVFFSQIGTSLKCYVSNCKSSVSTKCRVFPRWSSDTEDCRGSCYLLRNTSKNFVFVDRGCTGWSSAGCRPVVPSDGGQSDDYFHYELCYCNSSLCNASQTLKYSKKLLSFASGIVAVFSFFHSPII